MKIRFLSAFLALAMLISSVPSLAEDVEDIITEEEVQSDISQNYDSEFESEDLITIESENEISELLGTILVGYVDFENVLSRGEKQTGAKVIKNDDDYYLPIRAVASYIGGNCNWGSESNCVYISYGDYTMQIFPGKTSYLINGTEYAIKTAPEKFGDYVYLHTDTIAEIFKKNIYTDGSLVIVSDEKIDFNPETKNKMQFSLLAGLMFERPSSEKIWNDFVTNTGNKEHPRVILNQERIDDVLKRAETDEQYKLWIERVINTGEGIVATPVSEYTLEGGKMLTLSRTLMNRFRNLGMAYLLTRDQRFADRAWLEMEKIATYPSWNETHFLDVAELAAGFAYAYDWMYDGFTEEQRAKIRKMASVNAIYHALIAYRGTGPALPSTRYGWPKYDNNWNPVCNGGITMLCVAMLDEPDMKADALECITAAVKSLEVNMKQYYPEGVYYESNVYFLYTMEYLAPLLSTLDTAMGTNYGFIDSPGLVDSLWCRMHFDGPVKAYSYGDGGSDKIDMPEWAYFAKASDDEALMKRRADKIGKTNGGIKEIIWFDRDFAEGATGKDIPTDGNYTGTANVAFMRNSWGDSQALYLATRAGYTRISHGHIDIGSFHIEALGQLWTTDPGSGDYSWHEYFGSSRYNYYKTRAEGHNMVVVNPDETGGYGLDVITDIDMVSKPKGAYITLDMTEGYSAYGVTSAKRAMGLIDDRTRFIVQDEFTADKDSEFLWFMHTPAGIELSEDGRKAILSIDNRRMIAELISEGGVFTIRDSMSLETSPVYKGQTYPSCKKLTVHIENAKTADISVVFTPYIEGENVPYYDGEFKKISEWNIEDGEIPKLSYLNLDGVEYDGFNPNTVVYNIPYYKELPIAPVISAGSNEYDVEIVQADKVPGNGLIKLMKNGEVKKTINVNFLLKEVIGTVAGKEKYFPVYVDASDIPEAINGPMNLIDNDVVTKWAAQGLQYAIFDLGESKNVDTVSVAWMASAQRITPIGIYVSDDQKEWKQVYSGKSKGSNATFEDYSFDEHKARYVKLEVAGNNMGSWNSVLEVGIHGNPGEN